MIGAVKCIKHGRDRVRLITMQSIPLPPLQHLKLQKLRSMSRYVITNRGHRPEKTTAVYLRVPLNCIL